MNGRFRIAIYKNANICDMKGSLFVIAVQAVIGLSLISGGCTSTSKVASLKAASEWKLDWEDNFNSTELDTAVWGRCTRGNADWCNTLSDRDDLVGLRDGCLILRGIGNPDRSVDTVEYLTGGVWTKDRKAFEPGRIEIRARLHGARGAWPALWLLPYDHKRFPWPTGGEIDIMERLNYDNFAYQTVHSYYTYTLGQQNPPKGGTGRINPEEFNVYAVEIYPDSVVFDINGKHTLTYPRVATDKPGQFPYNIPMYLLMDMQLGGSWVGKVDPADLPVEMEIDWVRHYRRR